MERLKRTVLALAPVAALAASLYAVDLPLVAVSAGPARDVFPLIEVDGTQTTRPNGRLLLTTVNLVSVNVFDALRGWADPAVAVVPERDLVPRGQSRREYEQVSLSQMDESKIAATVVVLRRLTGYPTQHGRGALIQDVLRGAPADGKLFPGDLIISADGKPVPDTRALSRAILGTRGRRPLKFEVQAGGENRSVMVRPERVEDHDPPILLGVVPVENFPFEVLIRSGDIGGPSAGLMWAVGLSDLLSPVDLTAGREIAGTGEIGLDGQIGPIGGIEEKIRAAEQAGADLFLVPDANLSAARQVAEDIELVPVSTLDEALRFLEGQP